MDSLTGKFEMQIGTKLRAISLVGAISLALISCGRPRELRVDDVVLTLSPVDSNPSTMHFTVHGGEKDAKLLSVTSPSAVRAEMHESTRDAEGMMSMEKLEHVLIPRKSTLKFGEGGKHVMFWGVNLKARKLGEMETEFLFSNGDRILVDAVVQEMDGSVPDEKKAL
jgi:periplasmic copper chaperone A